MTDTPQGLKLQVEGHDVRYRNAWINQTVPETGQYRLLKLGAEAGTKLVNAYGPSGLAAARRIFRCRDQSWQRVLRQGFTVRACVPL